MFSFATLITLLENAPGEITAATTLVEGVETTISTLLQNPAVLALESMLASKSTITTTPGQAAVVEPMQATPAVR